MKIVNKRKKKLRLRLWVIIVCFFLFFFFLIYGGFKLYLWWDEGKKLASLEKEISNLTEVVEKEIPIQEIEKLEEEEKNNTSKKESDYFYYMKVPFLEVDFTKLKEKNSDTVGYIRVNGTNINYPIVYSGDNSYYLTHAFDRSKNYAGWVFLDQENNLDNLSDNTVIYGHGRLDMTVFGSLKNALTKEWQEKKENYSIQISTLNYNYVFQIFSIYTIPAESYYIQTSFSFLEEKQAWLTTMKERNQAIQTSDVTTSDSILTLSTCKDNNGTRIVVHAKLIKKEQRGMIFEEN